MIIVWLENVVTWIKHNFESRKIVNSYVRKKSGL